MRIETEKLLRELIALPSVNPAFVPEPNNKLAGEKRIAEFLAATAAAAGLDVELRDVLPNRPNLWVTLAPRKKARRRVLLAPHLDTVNASAKQFLPFKRNGKIYGRGACDTKGCIAAMLGALYDVARSPVRPAETELMFVGLMDEENLQAGSRALAKSKLKADLAIVGEPTSLRIVTAHKGSLWLQLESRGKSAHGSRPERGRNAVHMMARIVDLLETEYAALLRLRRHPLLGHATVNVGQIAGGTQANIVPDHCTILIDRRTLPGETTRSVERELLALLRKRRLEARLLHGKPPTCLPLETDSSLPLVQQFLASTGQREPAGVHYYCDASVLSRGGIPSVVFGPGDIAYAHSADEWVPLNELEDSRAMLTKFLKSLP